MDDLADLDEAERRCHTSQLTRLVETNLRPCDPARRCGLHDLATAPLAGQGIRAGVRRREPYPGQHRQAITPGDLENQARLPRDVTSSRRKSEHRAAGGSKLLR